MADGSITIKAILDDAEFKRRLQEIKSSLGSLETSGLDDIAESADKAEDALDDLGEAARQTKEDLDDAGGGAGDAGQKLDGLNTKGTKLKEGLGKAGSVLTRTVTPAIVGAAAASAYAAVKIDSSLTSVRKTVDGTEEQYQQLKESAIEFSKTNAVSASQILDIQALGAQLGYTIDELDDFGRVVSGLDIATDMSAEQAATELAQFANITGMAHSKTENYASSIVNLGNNLATTESQISSMSQRIGALANPNNQSIKMTTDEILGWSGAMSSLGVSAELGGTAFFNTVSTIGAAVSRGGEDLEVFASIANMSSEEFKQAWMTNSSEAMVALLSGVGSAENMTIALENMGVTGIRQSDVLSRLAGNTDLVTRALEYANAGWEQNTALQTEVDNRNQSLSARFEILKNRVIAMAEQFGGPLCNALLDAIDAAEPFIQLIADGAQAFADMDEDTQRLVLGVIGLSAAIGPTLSAGSKLIPIADKLGVSFDKMSLSTTSAKGAAAGLLAILAVDLMIQFNEYQGLLKDADQATHGFTEAMDEASIGASDACEGIDDAAGSLEGAGSAASDSTASFEDVTDATHDLTKKNAELASKIKDSYTQINANKDALNRSLGVIDKYANKVDETGTAAELSAAEQVELADAIKRYNDITGQSVSITDAATGKLSISTDELLENADAWEANARAQAAQQAYIDIMEQQIQTTQQLDTVTQQLAESEEGWGLWVGDFPIIADPASVAYHDLENQKKTLEEQNNSLAESEAFYREEIENAGVSIESVNELCTASSDALLGQTEAIDGAATEAELYAASLEAIAEELQTAIDESPLFAQAFEDSGYTVEDFAQKLSDTGVSVSDLQQSVTDLADQTCNEFDEIKVKSGVNLDEMLANLQNNQQIVANWQQNVAELYGKAGNEAQIAYISHLEEMGPESAEILAALNEDDGTKLAELAAAWDAGMQTAVDAPIDNLDAKAEAYKRVGAGLIESMVEGVSVNDDGLQVEVDSAIAKAFENVSEQDFEDYGGYIPAGLGEGIDRDAFKAELAAQGLSDDVIDAIMTALDAHSPSREAETVGGYIPAGLAEGIKGNTSPIQAASDMASSILRAINSALGGSEAEGSRVVGGFASGMASGVGEATTQALSVASATVRGLGTAKGSAPGQKASRDFSASLKSGSALSQLNGIFVSNKAVQGLGKGNGKTPGTKLGGNFASGVSSSKGAAASAGSSVASAAASSLSNLGTNSYEWGFHAGSNFASGLSSSVGIVSRAATSLAEAAASKIKHTVPKEGPLHNGGKGEAEWGEHAVMNFAQGFTNALPQFEQAIISIPQTAADVFKYIPADIELHGVAYDKASWVTPDGGASNNGGWAGTMKDLSIASAAPHSGSNDVVESINALIKLLPGIIRSSCPDVLELNKKEFGRLVNEVGGR